MTRTQKVSIFNENTFRIINVFVYYNSNLWPKKKNLRYPGAPRSTEMWKTAHQLGHSYMLYIFIHLVVCLTTGPKPLPKRALYIVRSKASSFKWEYPRLSSRSSSSFLRLLPRLPVTSIPLPFFFPSITGCRRQFLCILWPIQLAFRLLYIYIYPTNILTTDWYPVLCKMF